MTNNTQVIVWVHSDCLNPQNPALVAYPQAPALWVWDETLLREWCVSLKRMVTMYERLFELPVTIRRGDLLTELKQFATEHQAHTVATAASPNPQFTAVCNQLRQAGFKLDILPIEMMASSKGRSETLGVFRYRRTSPRVSVKSK